MVITFGVIILEKEEEKYKESNSRSKIRIGKSGRLHMLATLAWGEQRTNRIGSLLKMDDFAKWTILINGSSSDIKGRRPIKTTTGFRGCDSAH